MEQIDFFQMMAEQKQSKDEKEVEEVQEKVEKVKEEPKTKKVKPVKKAVKKEQEKKKLKAGGYQYPFSIYSEGRIIDISNYGFTDGQIYTENEITKTMLQHRHYEFSGKMQYSYIEDDNVLVVSMEQHRKG